MTRNYYSSRLSPTFADALEQTELRSHFAAFLSHKESAALLRFWLGANQTMGSDPSEPSIIAESSGLTWLLKPADFAKGLNHCIAVVGDELEKRHFVEFLSSTHFASYKLDFLISCDSERLTLEDIVFSETCMYHFREFIEQLPNAEDSSSMLTMTSFYLAAGSFCRNYSASTALDDALSLYEKYLSLNAERPLGFTNDVRRCVELSISSETGCPPQNTFEPALLHVRSLFSQRNIVTNFVGSAMFQDMQDDLKRRCEPTKLILPRVSSAISSHDEDTTSSFSSLSSSNVRRSVSLRVARIDERTGAYISEFNNPQFFEVNDSVSLPISSADSSTTIRRILSLRGVNASRGQNTRNLELEAEKKAAEIVEEITAIIASSSPSPTPRSSMAFDQ